MKKILKYIFIILFPYFVVFLICSLFNKSLMKSIYHNNFYTGLLYLFAFWLAAFISAIIISVNNLMNKADAVETAKINMVVKLVQIPAYLFIFVAGLVCLLTIFTFAITFVLVILDCASIILSGLIGISAVRRSYADEVLSKSEMVIYSILQFVFCFDVISSVIVFRKTKAKNTTKNF